jgi:hypothetical protein
MRYMHLAKGSKEAAIALLEHQATRCVDGAGMEQQKNEVRQ